MSYKKNWKQFVLSVFINTSQFMGGIIAYLILGIPVFANWYDGKSPAEIGQLISNYSFKCQYLIYLFTQLYKIFTEMPVIAGNAKRVCELLERMNEQRQSSKTTATPRTSQSDGEQDVCLEADKLSISIPHTGRVLVADLSFTFTKGVNILITGRSGCGKTSLFRCISGLWASYEGRLTLMRSERELFFLPQNPYFTCGSLLDQIVYPTPGGADQVDTNDPETIERLERVGQCMRTLHLEHLLDMCHGDLRWRPTSANSAFSWQTALSNGEKQRLSFLRIVYQRPAFALLDEFTSSVDQDTEAAMYEWLDRRLDCTYMSIAHRDTVRQFHHRELHMRGDTTYSLTALTTNQSQPQNVSI